MSVALMASANGDLGVLKEGMNGMAGSHSLEGAGGRREKLAKSGDMGGAAEEAADIASRPAQVVDGERQGGGREEESNGGVGAVGHGEDSSAGLSAIISDSSSAGVVSDDAVTQAGERVMEHGRSEGERGEEQANQVTAVEGHAAVGAVPGGALEQKEVAGVAEAPTSGSEMHAATGREEAVKGGDGEGVPGEIDDDGQRRVRWRDHAAGALTYVREFEPR